jgi:hypothetical protein
MSCLLDSFSLSSSCPLQPTGQNSLREEEEGGGGEPILELSLQLLEIQKLSFFFVELHLTHRQLFVQKVHLTQLVSMAVATEIKEATNLRVQLVDDPLVGSIGSQEILHLISRLRSLTPSQLRDAS